MRQVFRIGFRSWLVIGLLTLSVLPALAEEPTAKDAQALIDESIATLGRFVEDRGLKDFRSRLREAKGVIIVPRLVAAGLIVGGSGGKCTALAR